VLEDMFRNGDSPELVIEKRGFKPITDPGELEALIREAEEENPGVLAKIGEGETKPIDYLIGQVMRKSRGKADPKLVREIVEKRLLR